MKKQPSIDTFIEQLPAAWQKEQCTEIVRLIRASGKPIAESIKWGNPYFDYNGGLIKVFCAKSWINIYFYKGYLLEDSHHYFEASDNSRMRTIKLFANKPLEARLFTDLLAAAIKLNEA